MQWQRGGKRAGIFKTVATVLKFGARVFVLFLPVFEITTFEEERRARKKQLWVHIKRSNSETMVREVG